jgi:hypothetical protein
MVGDPPARTSRRCGSASSPRARDPYRHGSRSPARLSGMGSSGFADVFGGRNGARRYAAEGFSRELRSLHCTDPWSRVPTHILASCRSNYCSQVNDRGATGVSIVERPAKRSLAGCVIFLAGCHSKAHQGLPIGKRSSIAWSKCCATEPPRSCAMRSVKRLRSRMVTRPAPAG